MARTSSEKPRDGDAIGGAAGRGGSTITLRGIPGDDDTGDAADDCGTVTEMGSVTTDLYKKGSDDTVTAAGEDCGGELSARSGLMGRHSSSKVTDRLEMTVLDAG